MGRKGVNGSATKGLSGSGLGSKKKSAVSDQVTLADGTKVIYHDLLVEMCLRLHIGSMNTFSPALITSCADDKDNTSWLAAGASSIATRDRPSNWCTGEMPPHVLHVLYCSQGNFALL